MIPARTPPTEMQNRYGQSKIITRAGLTYCPVMCGADLSLPDLD